MITIFAILHYFAPILNKKPMMQEKIEAECEEEKDS